MKKIFPAILFAVLLATNGWVNPAQATMLSTATRTLTPRVKATPTRTPLPSLLSILPNEMDFFFGGGGGGYSIDDCKDFLKNYHGTYPVAFVGEQYKLDESSLCIAGLPMKNSLHIGLKTTTGKNIGTSVFKALAGRTGIPYVEIYRTNPTTDNVYSGVFGFDENKVPIITFGIVLPPDFPYNQLQIEVQSDVAKFAGTIKDVSWKSDFSYLFVSNKNFAPFIDPAEEYRLKLNQQLIIKGINYPKASTLPLGLYRAANDKLVYSNWVQTNAQGLVALSLSFDSNDPPGDYTLTVLPDPKALEPGQFVEHIYADTCPGAPASYLSVGDKIIINPELPKSNNIREQAGSKRKITGEFKVHQTATVTDGMKCADQMVWWKIRTSAGQEGWTSEGQGDEHWLVQLK